MLPTLPKSPARRLLQCACASLFTLLLLPAHGGDTAGTATTPAAAAVSAAQTRTAATATSQADHSAQHFLDNYLGTWEGHTELRSLDGSLQTRIQVRIEYDRDSGEAGVVNGRAVFAAGNRIIHATSQTRVVDGTLVSVIDRSGVKATYAGRINPEGTSITWHPLDAADALNAYHKDSFSLVDGTIQLLTEGYEDYQNQGLLLTQKTVLTRTAR